MPHCWKSHVTAQILVFCIYFTYIVFVFVFHIYCFCILIPLYCFCISIPHIYVFVFVSYKYCICTCIPQILYAIMMHFCPCRLHCLFSWINTFTAKHLKKPIPQCQACFKDSWILRVYEFNTEYLQNHSNYCCETFTECCLYVKLSFKPTIIKIVTFGGHLWSHIENIKNAYKQLFYAKIDKTSIYTKYHT